MRLPRGQLPGKQRGVALITALLVMTLATTAAVEMVYRQQLDIRRTQNVIARDQAYMAALAAEGVVRSMLRSSLSESKQPIRQEDLDKVSAQFQSFSYWGVNFSLEVHDLQGRFNLNNLVAGNEPSPIHLEQFRRLAGLVSDGQNAIQVNSSTTDLDRAIVDWIDKDLQGQVPGGAEDDMYTRTVGTYRTANRPMVGPSELRLVMQLHAGDESKMAEQWYQMLRPYITALPQDTTINVNAASATVLASLLPGVSLEGGKKAVEARAKDEPYADVQDFLKRNPDFNTEDLDESLLGVGSQFYLAKITTQAARANITLYSVLQRGGQQQGSVGAPGQGAGDGQNAPNQPNVGRGGNAGPGGSGGNNGGSGQAGQGFHVLLRSLARP